MKKDREYMEIKDPHEMWNMKLILEKALQKKFGDKCFFRKDKIKKGDKYVTK